MRRWLYLVGCYSGTIKIGVSYSPEQRFTQHHKTFGDDFAWCHLFAGYAPRVALGLERKGIEAFAKMGTRVGKTECFTGIEKPAAIACVRALIAEAAASEDRWAVERIRNVVEFAARAAFSEGRDFCWLRSATQPHPVQG